MLKARGVSDEEYVAQGFKLGWIQRKGKPQTPPGHELIRLVTWLEAPPDFLFAAAPELEGLHVDEVLSRSTLEIFMKRDVDGRRARHLRSVCEDIIDAHHEHAPNTVSRWRATVDAIARGQRLQGDEIRRLNESVRDDG